MLPSLHHAFCPNHIGSDNRWVPPCMETDTTVDSFNPCCLLWSIQLDKEMHVIVVLKSYFCHGKWKGSETERLCTGWQFARCLSRFLGPVSCFCVGQILIMRWSNPAWSCLRVDQILLMRWSNPAYALVKFWLCVGQILLTCWSNPAYVLVKSCLCVGQILLMRWPLCVTVTVILVEFVLLPQGYECLLPPSRILEACCFVVWETPDCRCTSLEICTCLPHGK